MYVFIEGEQPALVNNEDIKSGTFEVETAGTLFQVRNNGTDYRVTNAVNGYGQNVAKEYAERKVWFMKLYENPNFR